MGIVFSSSKDLTYQKLNQAYGLWCNCPQRINRKEAFFPSIYQRIIQPKINSCLPMDVLLTPADQRRLIGALYQIEKSVFNLDDYTQDIGIQLLKVLQLPQPVTLRTLGTVDARLGSGSFASVYKGVLSAEKDTSVTVAYKVFKKGKCKDLLLYRDELLAHSRTFPKHEHIIGILGYMEHEKILVLEYAENGSLFNHLQFFSALDQLEILKKLIEAVFHLRWYCVAHLDIKPENVLLDKDNHPKLADFGFSTVFPTLPMHSKGVLTGFVGTLMYAAPEMLMLVPLKKGGLSMHSSMRFADVYSLGMVAAEMANGPLHDVCFKNDTTSFEFVTAVLETQFRPELPFPDRFLSQLAKKLWAQDPEQRLTLEAASRDIDDEIVRMASFSENKNTFFKAPTDTGIPPMCEVHKKRI